MAFYLIRWIRREILLAKPKEKILSVRDQRTLGVLNGPFMIAWSPGPGLSSLTDEFFDPISAVVLFNLFFLFILYSTDHTLRHQATFTLRRILGYHEENVIYEKVIQGKAIGMKYTSISRHVVTSCFLKILLTTIMLDALRKPPGYKPTYFCRQAVF